MRKRWKVVSKWLHRRARARRVNETLAALDTPSRLDKLDRSTAGREDVATDQELLRLLPMMMHED